MNAANRILSAILLAGSVAVMPAHAAPQGGAIVAGEGQISNSSNLTTITQQTNSMVIDWSSFNISSNETVNFAQPSANAAALNRIFDQDPSRIFGAINANGRVFLSNPNGMIFGETSTVNVGALFATSLGTSGDDFMAGNYRFIADGYAPGAIINHGTLLAATGGSISLAGGRVENTGVIIAGFGRVNLATGTQAVLSFDADGLIGFEVDEDVLSNLDGAATSVHNSGLLQADGGTIILEANVAADIFTRAVNNQGMIRAHRIDDTGGEIYLSSNGETVHAGAIDAYGDNGRGGTVFILGDTVSLADSAGVEASGAAGGGEILIGGDYQGQGDVATARFTRIDDGAIISADAEQAGDGGKVIVWADDSTRAYGSISARGGGEGGDGGFVEVSGKGWLDFNATVDTRAPAGNDGMLLLDPTDIDIVAADTATADTKQTGQVFQDDTAIATSEITILALTNALSNGNVTITTSNVLGTGNGDIDWQAGADLDINTLGTRRLTLIADRNITLSAGITDSVAGGDQLSLDVTGLAVDVNANIALSGGDFISNGTTFDNDGFTIATGDGAITLMHSGNVTLGVLDAGAGNVDITASGGIIEEGNNDAVRNIISTGTVDLTASGRIGNYTGGNARPLDIDTANLIVDAGAGVNIAVTSSDNASTARDLASLSLTTDADLGGNSDITAANLTFDVSDSAAITTIANVTDTTGLSFTFVNSAGAVDITDGGGAGGINVGPGTVNLTSSLGNITQSADDIISAGLLVTNTPVGSTTLDSANTITSYNGSSTVGNITITDSTGGLVITGITTTTGDATIVSNGGAITQSGSIVTDKLTTTSTNGSTTLDNTANTIANYDGTSTGAASDIQITDSAGGLVIERISSGRNATIQTTGALTQGATNAISAALLTTTSTNGSTTLDNTANTIANYDGTSTGAASDIQITDSAGGLVIERISSGRNATIQTTGALTQGVTNAISAALLTTTSTNGSTTLDNTANTIANYDGTSTGAASDIQITDSAGGLVIERISSGRNATIQTTGALTQGATNAISAALLTTTSTNGSTTLDNTANTIANYDGTSTGAASDIQIFDSAGGLVIERISSGRNATIVTTGDLTQQTGVISAVALTTTSTTGSTMLTANNTVSSYAGTTTGTNKALAFTNTTGVLDIAGITATGDVTLVTDQVDITGAVSAAGRTVTLRSNTTGGSIDLGSMDDLVATAIELSSAEIDLVTATTLYVGAADAGAVSVSDTLALANISQLHIETAAGVTDGTAGVITGNRALAIDADGNVTLNNAGHDVATLAVNARSNDLTFVNGGATSALTVGLVGGIAGLTASDVNLTAAANNIIINRDIDASGAIDVTAQATDALIRLAGTRTITGTAATHTYTADRMDIAGTIDATGQRVILQSATAARDLILGPVSTDTAPGSLELSDAELDSVTADTLLVGRTSADDIFVTLNISPANISNLHLVTGDQVNADTASILLGSGNLAVTAGGDVRINTGSTDVSTLAIEAPGGFVYFIDANNVTTGDVDGVSGIAADELLLYATSSLTVSDGADTNDIDVTTTAVLSAGTDITGDGTIIAPQLALGVGNTGSATLTSPNSDADLLATTDNNNGSVTFTDVDDLNIGSFVIPFLGTSISGLIADTVDLTVNGTLTLNASSGIAGSNFVNDAEVILRADRMVFDGVILAYNGRVTLEPLTANLAIDLGSTTDVAVDTLELSSAEISNVTAQTLVIGNAQSGAITLTDTITPSNASSLYLKSGANVDATAGDIDGVTPALDLAISAVGDVVFNTGATQVRSFSIETTGDITFVSPGILVSQVDVSPLSAPGTEQVTGVSGNNVTLTASVSDLELQEAITASGAGNIDLTAQNNLISSAAGDDISSGSGDITIRADGMSLSGGILSSTGNLVIEVITAGGSIGLGNSATGQLNINNAELLLIQDGFNSVTIGSAAAGNIDIQGAIFNDDTTINAADFTVDTINALANTLNINAAGTIKQEAGTTGPVTAGTLNLTAGNQAAETFAIGDNADYLYVDVATQVNADAPNGGSIYISSTGDLQLGAFTTADTVNLRAAGAIIDTSPAATNVTAMNFVAEAVNGIGAAGAIEVDSDNLGLTNTGTGNIVIVEANDTTLLSSSNASGDISVNVADDLVLNAGLTLETTALGSIILIAGNAITGAGAVTVDAVNGFTYDKTLAAAGAVSITTGDQFSITENISTTAGDITLGSTMIDFSSNAQLDAAGAINIPNAAVTANGNLTFNANGIGLGSTFTHNNGDLVLNAGADDLSIANVLTINNGNLNIVASDLDITPTGSIVGTDTVTITDNGNGIELGGTPDPAKLNISLSEYDLITAGAVVLQSPGTLTLNQASFVANTSASPLTIDADQMVVSQAGAVLGLNGDLDLADTAVTATDLTLNIGGAFAMNNTVTTNGAFTLAAAQGITMNEPSSITSNGNRIDITATGGDILLGLVDAGANTATITSQAGSILNNNGVFTDVTLSRTNVQAANVNLDANQRIGASTTDAITINASPTGLITLDYDADKAFINNLQNTRIQNNGTGDVAVGLIFSAQIIGIGQNVGVSVQGPDDSAVQQEPAGSFISVLGADYKLADVDEEEDDVSTFETTVPVMIRTKQGWEFRTSLAKPGNP